MQVLKSLEYASTASYPSPLAIQVSTVHVDALLESVADAGHKIGGSRPVASAHSVWLQGNAERRCRLSPPELGV